MDSATGPGRPECVRSKAAASDGAIAAVSESASAQRVTGRKQSIWFGTSCSAPRPRPTSADAMSDMITKTGTDPEYDSASGVSVFVAAGPLVTMTMPGAPEARA